MIKFILQLLTTFLITLVIWTVLYSSLAMHLHVVDLPRSKYKLKIIDDKRASFETLVVGDSASDAAILPILKEGKRFNMSLRGGTPIDALISFKRYLKFHSPPKKLIISFSRVGMMTRPDFYTRGLMLNQYTFWELLEIGSDLDDLELIHNRKPELTTILIDLFKKNNLDKWIYDYELFSVQMSLSRYQFALIKNFFDPNIYRVNVQRYNDLVNNPNMYEEHLLAPNNVRNSQMPEKFVMNKIYKSSIEKMIKLATSKGTSVYAISPPVSEVYKDYAKTQIFKDVYWFYNNLALNNPLLHVYPTVEIYPITLFEDTFHVSAAGASKFSKLVNTFISDVE